MDETALPKDWDRLLQRFARTLAEVQKTLTKAEGWQSGAPAQARAAAHESALAAAAQQIQDLDGKATKLTQWVDAIESELRVSEDLLRVLLTQTEAVRQKLATWATRAIG